MSISHNLGFPRIGTDRELKKASESYWQGLTSLEALQQPSKQLRHDHWKLQADSGLDLIPVGDFSNYDQVLDMSCLLGVIPPRFKHLKQKQSTQQDIDINEALYFVMARGTEVNGQNIAPCEMTKWFDTNYHYLVPEIKKNQSFQLSFNKLFNEIKEAQSAGYNIKPVLIGPITWLWLAKTRGEDFDKLQLLAPLIDAYKEILQRLEKLDIEWVQIDEPVLTLDLPIVWKSSLEFSYRKLRTKRLKILLTTYFGSLNDKLPMACNLAIDALHIDLVRGPNQLNDILKHLPENKILSLGIIDGRNIWRTDLDQALKTLRYAQEKLGDRLWIAPSCSLIHVPVDLQREEKLDKDIKSWLSFARQKLDELNILKTALSQDALNPVENLLNEKLKQQLSLSREAINNRKHSEKIHQQNVKQRVSLITEDMLSRHTPFNQRRHIQQQALKLPVFPTTTIGSFPQTTEIRQARRSYRQGELKQHEYINKMQQEITHVIAEQESLGLDVLVHGEAERNDMVEYFAELLDGFAFTEFAWVQSYGSRCVKPPIIYGDISRPHDMTVMWSKFAQSCTDKPIKGMLTGPVTMLNWSFVRDDQPRSDTAMQIALALRDEVDDLQKAGINIIQIDEAALREGLPLQKNDWQEYLDWTVRAFRLSAGIANDKTQIHTHMCYSQFNDIIQAIADMDADVITIETSRSDMQLLAAFETFDYPNEVGPGVYDIHSENIPSTQQMVDLINLAASRIPAERLWINPDCGLKTRQWPEVKEALSRMVKSAQQLRAEYVN